MENDRIHIKVNFCPWGSDVIEVSSLSLLSVAYWRHYLTEYQFYGLNYILMGVGGGGMVCMEKSSFFGSVLWVLLGCIHFFHTEKPSHEALSYRSSCLYSCVSLLGTA